MIRGLLLSALFFAANADAAPRWKHFRGVCDASAIEMLSPDLFVAANDEDNVLRVYSRSAQGAPVQLLDLSSLFHLPKRAAEFDLEGAARLGDRIFWISSHGADTKGKPQPSRRRFFATQITTNAGGLTLGPSGRLWSNLVDDMLRDPALTSLGLAKAARQPPKDRGGLNIEGLAATPEGHLLIAFRNPVPDGKALILPMLNPVDVTSGRAAKFGRPLLLDLNGLGIRGITSHKGGYLIVGGPLDGGAKSQLFHWDGRASTARSLTPRGLAGNPESLGVIESNGAPALFVLSDDGSQKIGGKKCKDLKDASLKSFRGYELPLNQ